MDLIVLAKYVPDVLRVPEDAWDHERGTLRRNRLKMVFNPHDRVALRTALSIREAFDAKWGQAPISERAPKSEPVPISRRHPQSTITVVTMGPPVAVRLLREAVAHGADRAVLLTDRAFAGADTLATAYALTQAIRHLVAIGRVSEDFIVLCGMQSPDGDTAQVPAEVASLLDVPIYPYVCDVLLPDARAASADGGLGLRPNGTDDARAASADGGLGLRLNAGRRTPNPEPPTVRFRCLNPVGFQVVTPRSRPYVVTTTRLAEDLPFYVSLDGILRAAATEIVTLGAAAVGADPARIGLDGSRTRVVRIYASERKAQKAEPLVAGRDDFPDRVRDLCRRLRAAFAEKPSPPPPSSASDERGGTPSAEGEKVRREEGKKSTSGEGEKATGEASGRADGASYYAGPCLAVCEADEAGLTPVSFEVVSRAAHLARALGTSCHAVIHREKGVGPLCFVDNLRLAGAETLHVLSAKGVGACVAKEQARGKGVGPLCLVRAAGEGAFRVREEALALAAFIEELRPQIVILPATLTGRIIAPYVAARLDCGLTADCSALDIADYTAFDREAGREVTYHKVLQQTRPALGGNIMARIVSIYRDQTAYRPQMATARPGALTRVDWPAEKCEVRYVTVSRKWGQAPISKKASKSEPVPISAKSEPVPISAKSEPVPISCDAEYVLERREEAKAEIDLRDFEAIVCVGMGVRNRATIDRLVVPFCRRLGEFLGCEVGLGCSRAVVDAGILPHSHQIGQTGIVVKPRLYVGLGVSGAIQHRIGMEGARLVVTVNPDPAAPLHALADFSIIGEIEAALPILEDALRPS